ncbi:glutathione S-transferase [Stachybotrys elegans]|uniref:Glutathione S-transferase n=1 Tax=Stachybotrys elegans TaxID=80388 RepID=A0A8K0WTE0_9HYPO|nr:glutathione S-transferase [Stachybotrys elegans]
MGIKTDITLYTEGTPNGLKISIALEELGLEYKVRSLDLTKLEQKEPWFLEINPNGRIPALTDKDENGNELKIFESGAILEYLVGRYDKDHKISYSFGSKEHWETTSWLMWQMGGLGPMQGQANHFARFAGAIYPYALNRYVHESRRLYRVLDAQIAKNPSGYIVGDHVSIADIACWPWVCAWKYSAVPELDEFPNVQKWMHRLLERPGFERGRNVPGPHYHMKLNELSEEEMNELSKARGAWVQVGMKRDAEA